MGTRGCVRLAEGRVDSVAFWAVFEVVAVMLILCSKDGFEVCRMQYEALRHFGSCLQMNPLPSTDCRAFGFLLLLQLQPAQSHVLESISLLNELA